MLALLLLLAACGGGVEVIQPTAGAEADSSVPAATETAEQEPTAVTEDAGAPPAPSPQATPPPAEAAAAIETAVPEATPLPTSEGPVTLLINADGSGDLATLEEALAYAAPGSTIELSAGDFIIPQTLVIEKPLAISGAGIDRTAIITQSPIAGLQYAADGLLSISDLTLRHAGGIAADLLGAFSGDVELANCRLQGAPISQNGAYGAGLFILNEARVSVSGCEIVDNGGAGILLIRQGQITLRDSLVAGNEAGILFDGESAGQISDSVIEANRDVGIYVFALAAPQITNNVIQNNAGYGIHYQLDDDVGGQVRDNELVNNDVVSATATGTDIIIYDIFTPQLSGNTCQGGEGLALLLGTTVAADPSGIIFFNTGVGRPQEITVEDNACAVAFCNLNPGATEFQLVCENPT